MERIRIACQNPSITINAFTDPPIRSGQHEIVVFSVSMSNLRPAFSSTNIVNMFPQRLRDSAIDAEMAIRIVKGVMEKLREKGYSVETDDRKPIAGLTVEVLDKPEIALRMGEDFQPDIYATIGAGPNDKTEGLAEAIKTAYDEVVRENKPIAAYMSKSQGAVQSR